MLAGDWDGQSPKYRGNIQKAIEETEEIAEKAKVQSAFNAKFTKVLNPLT